MKNKRIFKILIAVILAVLLYLPFLIIPNSAVMISATAALILSIVFVFYQVALVFFEKKEHLTTVITPIGLPGENKPTGPEAVPKKKKITVAANLPGVKQPTDNKTQNVVPEFEIEDLTPKPVKMFAEVNEVDLMRGILEIINFWDGLSFYKIKDSEVYSNATVKTIGELYDSVFGGLGAYLQRYKLTLDDLLNEDTVVKEYSEPFSSVVIAFVISLIEKEAASSVHKHIDRTEIVIPKTKIKNPALAKVVMSPEFKYQVLLMIRKYYEKQKHE